MAGIHRRPPSVLASDGDSNKNVYNGPLQAGECGNAREASWVRNTEHADRRARTCGGTWREDPHPNKAIKERNGDKSVTNSAAPGGTYFQTWNKHDHVGSYDDRGCETHGWRPLILNEISPESLCSSNYSRWNVQMNLSSRGKLVHSDNIY